MFRNFSRWLNARSASPPPTGSTSPWWLLDAPAAAGPEPQGLTEDCIEDYLDHVSARLLALPYERWREIRNELRLHLVALVQAYERTDSGGGPGAAAEAALRKFGDPACIGQEYRHAWLAAAERHSLFPRTAVRHGLGWFGGAALLFLGLFAADVSGFGNGALLGISTNKLSLVAFWMPPLVAGWKTAQTAPARPGLGAFYAQAILTCATLPLAVPILAGGYSRAAECLVLVPILLALWIPLGSLSAVLADACFKRHWFSGFRTAR